MAQCEANKTSGERCNGTAKQGHRWCAYHQRKFAKNVKHGNTAAPELLGIPQNQHLTFQQFYEQEKPLELLQEIAYLRTLGVELRKSIDRNRQEARDELLDEFEAMIQDFLVENGFEDEGIAVAKKELREEADLILESHMGPAEPITADDIEKLRNHIEAISRVAEKAKKIKDGFTLTIDMGGVHPVLMAFTQQVVLPNITDRLQRSQIVESARAFSAKGITKALTDGGYN